MTALTAIGFGFRTQECSTFFCASKVPTPTNLPHTKPIFVRRDGFADSTTAAPTDFSLSQCKLYPTENETSNCEEELSWLRNNFFFVSPKPVYFLNAISIPLLVS